MVDISKVSVTATKRIVKYAEGANPETDQPFDVVEKNEELTGQAAVDYLNQMGVKVDGVN